MLSIKNIIHKTPVKRTLLTTRYDCNVLLTLNKLLPRAGRQEFVTPYPFLPRAFLTVLLK